MDRNRFWAWVAARGWAAATEGEKQERFSFDDILDMSRASWRGLVSVYGEREADVVVNEIKAQFYACWSELGCAAAEYERTKYDRAKYGPYSMLGSDDSREYLLTHVVGCGKERFEECMRDPSLLREMYKADDYCEGFRSVVDHYEEVRD